jgi:hypothetical protein
MNEQLMLLDEFIKTHDVSEVAWRGENLEMCLIWIPYHDLADFVELFEWYFETENETQATLQKENACIDLVELFQDEISLKKWMSKESEAKEAFDAMFDDSVHEFMRSEAE